MWTYHVVHSARRQRHIIFTGTGSTPLDAVRQLHQRSAEAVEKHIAAYGLREAQLKIKGKPYAQNRRGSDVVIIGDDESGDEREPVRVSKKDLLSTKVHDDHWSSESSADSDSDSTISSVLDMDDLPAKGGRKGKSKAKNVYIHSPPSYRTLPRAAGPSNPYVYPSANSNPYQGPGWPSSGRAVGSPPFVTPGAAVSSPPPSFTSPGAKTVIIMINWSLYQIRVVETCELTLEAIRSAAASAANMHRGEFTYNRRAHVPPAPGASPQVTVTKVHLGNESYELSPHVDDLRGLPGMDQGIPRFDATVTWVPPQPAWSKYAADGSVLPMPGSGVVPGQIEVVGTY